MARRIFLKSVEWRWRQAFTYQPTAFGGFG